MGWLLLCASIGAVTAVPVLTITSLPSDGTPEFIIEADWVAGDDLQFERQVAGGDWSGATVTHHTIASAELVGLPVDFVLPVLADGTYNFRCKRNGGAYSSVITSTILVPKGNYTFQDAYNGNSGNDGGNVIDYVVDLGAGSTDKVLLFGVGIGSTAGSLDSLVIDPSGVNIVLTTPINAPTSTYRVAFFSLPASTLSGTKTIQLNTTGLGFIERDLHVWSMTGLTSNTYKNAAIGSAINMTADAGDLVFVLAEFNGAITWNGSSETPVGQRYTASFPSSADWKVISNYPASSFAIVPNIAGIQAAVSFA